MIKSDLKEHLKIIVMSNFLNEIKDLLNNISVKYLVVFLLFILAAMIVSRILRFFFKQVHPIVIVTYKG